WTTGSSPKVHRRHGHPGGNFHAGAPSPAGRRGDWTPNLSPPIGITHPGARPVLIDFAAHIIPPSIWTRIEGRVGPMLRHAVERNPDLADLDIRRRTIDRFAE